MKLFLFPHFYLSNDTLVRHQYLYTESLERLLSSDRPTRDDKQVKQLIAALQYPENRVVQHQDKAIQRFINVLQEAYEKKNENYFPVLQKFGVERTATKTFHFSRLSELEPAVEKMQALGFAKPDLSGSWCMSTPKMVQLFVTCATVEYQQDQQLPRCTDHPEHDRLATVIEALHQSGSGEKQLTRLILEYPYFVPKEWNLMTSDELLLIREKLLSLTEQYTRQILEAASQLTSIQDSNRIKPVFNASVKKVQDHNQAIQTAIKDNQYTPEEFRMQYRFYAQPKSSFPSWKNQTPISTNKTALHYQTVPASVDTFESLHSYPGCFVWTLEPLDSGKGIFNRLQRLWG